MNNLNFQQVRFVNTIVLLVRLTVISRFCVPRVSSRNELLESTQFESGKSDYLLHENM